MKTKEIEAKEREREEKIKALRKELEVQLEEQLSSEAVEENPALQVQKIAVTKIEDPDQAKKVIEALLFASSKPLTIAEIRRVIGSFSASDIEMAIGELKETFTRDGRSFEILEIAGGYEIATKKEFAPWIFKIELQKKARQASQSALETLAILAYKQPMTRAEIEDLRGVDVSGVLNTLTARGFIKIVGRKEILGRPFLYGTTEKFLEHFGLKSLQALPNIDEIKSVVENSVKKEELLGRPHMIEVPQTEETSVPVQNNEQVSEMGETISQENENGSESDSQKN